MMRMILATLAFAPAPALSQVPPAAPVSATPAPIDPAHLAAADRAVLALLPPGTFLRIMRDQFPKLMDGMMGRMFGMTGKDLGVPPAAGAGAGEGEKTLGEIAGAQDPHFRERMSIMTRVFSEELGTLYSSVEPEMRAGLSRAFARKFTLQQLGDMNAFFATPSGRAFAGEYLASFMDPEVMEGMMSALPRMMQVMPTIIAKVEQATAHLPPPPKPVVEAEPDAEDTPQPMSKPSRS